MNNTCLKFIEQLRGVPKDYKTAREIQWATDGTPTGHQFIPVGYMFHKAADELECLSAEIAAVKVERDGLRKDAELYRWLRVRVNSTAIEPPLTVAKVSGWGLVDAWSGDDLDAAIQTAIIKPTEGGQA